MRKFNVLAEEDLGIDIAQCLDIAKRFYNAFGVLGIDCATFPREVFTYCLNRSYEKAHDCDRLFEYLSSKGLDNTIVLLKNPLLCEDFKAVDPKTGKIINPNIHMALGTVDLQKKYPLVSAYGFGKHPQSTERVARVLAHEMVHATTGVEDGCCLERRCIMYNSQNGPYTELPDDVLKILDGKNGWCRFHSLVLAPHVGRGG